MPPLPGPTFPLLVHAGPGGKPSLVLHQDPQRQELLVMLPNTHQLWWGHSGLFWRPLGAPQDWDNLGNWGLSEGRAWHPRPQLRARQTLKLLLHPPPIRGLLRNEESLNSLLQTLLRLVIHLELSEQQTPRVGQSCPPPRSARLSPAVPL